MSVPVLGIDPGHDGGAVLLASDGRTIHTAWGWRRLTDRYSVTELSAPGVPVEHYYSPSLHALSSRIAAAVASRQVPWVLAIEGLFIWPGRVIDGIVELIEATGELKGPLADCASRVERPQASTWRAAVLPRGWGRASAESERAALSVCRSTMRELAEFSMSEQDAERREVPLWPHVVEAACIARWGWVEARGIAQQSMVRR